MKTKSVLLCMVIALTFSSCATILGGKVSECQKRKPTGGEPKREVRWASVAANLVCACPECIVVDICTKAIYKPCETDKKKK